MAENEQDAPELEKPKRGEVPKPGQVGYIDPTDQDAVAAYIEQHGIVAFQKERNRQTGTTYA